MGLDCTRIEERKTACFEAGSGEQLDPGLWERRSGQRRECASSALRCAITCVKGSGNRLATTYMGDKTLGMWIAMKVSLHKVRHDGDGHEAG